MTHDKLRRMSLRKARRELGARHIYYEFKGELVPVTGVTPWARVAYVVLANGREFPVDWRRQVYVGGRTA